MRHTPLAYTAALLLASCAPSPHGTVCGVSAPVDVIVDSNQFADVVVRDADGRRLGMAVGKQVTRFRFCSYDGMAPRFILDPIGGSMGYILDATMSPIPGSVVLMTFGSELRISFAAVILPTPGAP